MLKISFVVAVTGLAVALPSAAQDKDQPVAPIVNPSAAHSKTSASDRNIAKQLAATGAATAAVGAARPQTRDWAAIDTDKDNLISPDEMQKYLDGSWAAAKK